MSVKLFTCPKCGTQATVQKIQDQHFACPNSRCPLHDRLVAHVDLSSSGQVTKIYSWLLESGSILNERYLIDRLLGKGGFGATYLARDRKMFDKLRAIKEIPLIYFNEQEEEFLTRLDHPAIPKLIERFNINGLHYSVMEYFEGTGLDTLVQQAHSGLPEGTVLKIAEPLCNVLSYIHSQKVIHRDLKPENILVDNDSIALIDFGIAKQYDPGQGTRRLARAASSFYSSPEQYQAGKGFTDVKSDIYSLGAMLYFMVTGKAPIDALSRDAAKDIEPAPRQLNPKISIHIEKVILKAMKMHKSDRFASISQLKKALLHPHSVAGQICHQCGVTLLTGGNFCPNCGHATLPLVDKSLTAFVFRTGERVLNLEQFIHYCYTHWETARWHLLRGDFIEWLEGQPDKNILRKAKQSKNQRTDPDRLLNEFLAASRFGAPPQLKIKSDRFEFSRIPRGKTARGTIQLSNPGKGLLKGELKSDAKWLKLESLEFACAGSESCRIGFSLKTEMLKPARVYQTEILVRTNVTSIALPVIITVIESRQVRIDPEKIQLELKPGRIATVELRVENTGDRERLNWQVQSDQTWLRVPQASFRARSKSVPVQISAQKLPEGDFRSLLRVRVGEKTIRIPVGLAVTTTAHDPVNRISAVKQILQPIFFMVMAALTIGQTGANPMLQIGQPWQIILFAAMGGYWGINQNWIRTFAGVVAGSLAGLFWHEGMIRIHQFLSHYFLQPLYQVLSLNGSQQNLFGWALLGLYLGGIVALVRVGVARRRLWRYCMVGVPGLTFGAGMVFWGLPYLIAG